MKGFLVPLLLGTQTLLTMIACSEKSLIHSVPKGYVESTQDLWESDVISVCFEDAGYEANKLAVASAITEAFSPAGFIFVGWNDCSTQSPSSIRLKFDPGSSISVTKAIGPSLVGIAGGVTLGVRDYSCPVAFEGSPCLKNTAIHEFGHVLGLHHEMNRPDNKTCDAEQIGHLASDLIQIGRFDDDSIMNYCAVWRASKKAVTIRLSEGDVRTLHTLYRTPMAALNSLPRRLATSENLNLNVSGRSIQFYRYLIGLESDVDCSSLDEYSEVFSIDRPIASQSFTSMPVGRVLRVCLLGGNKELNWQDLDSYSSYQTVLLNRQDQEPPFLSNITVVDDADSNSWKIRAIWQDESDVENFSIEINYADSSFHPSLKGLKALPGSLSGEFVLHIPKKILDVKGRPYISQASAIDVNGNAVSLQSSPDTMELRPGLSAPSWLVDKGVDFEMVPPAVELIKFGQNCFSKDERLVMTLRAFDTSGIQGVRLKTIGKLTGRKKLMYSHSVEMDSKDPSTYQIFFNAPGWKEVDEGEWTIQSIDLYDRFGAQVNLKSGSPDNFNFDGTEISIPYFQIAKDCKLVSDI